MRNSFSYHGLLLSLFTTIFVFFFISCEYEPSGQYNVNLEKPAEAPPIEFDLNLMTDTISFYWAGSVTLKINSGPIKINSVKFFLDGQIMEISSSGSKYFTVLNFSQPGIHKFRIEVFTGSGSHSIAEGLGVEGFQYNFREWTLVAKPVQQGNLQYRIDNNGLTFFWKKYDGTDLKEYRIKEIESGQVFLNIKSPEFNYSSYVGQAGCYDLYAVDVNDNELLWGRCFLDRSLPALRISGINKQVAVVWNNTIFKNNIAEYQLFQKDLVSELIKVGTFSTNDTTYILPDIENLTGHYLSFYLYCVPKSNTYIQNIDPYCSSLQNVNPVLTGPKFSGHFGATCMGFYFTGYSADFQKTLLLKYSAGTDRIDFIKEFEPNGSNDLSPNARYFLCSHDSIMDLFDLSTNNIIKSINIKAVVPAFHWSVGPKVSDNGICIFYLENLLYVFDVLNDKLIGTLSMIPNTLNISPDGKYFTAIKGDSLVIYQVEGNSINLISYTRHTDGPFYQSYNFCANQPDCLYTFEPPLLNVRSCRDLSVIRSLDIGDFFYNIDFCNNKVLSTRGGDYLNVYDYLTGDLLHTVRFGIPGGAGSQYYTLLTDNTIYFSEYKYYLPGNK